MPVIQQNVSLEPFNSLALPAEAEFFCTVRDRAELCAALQFAHSRQLVVTPIGGGSNIVLAANLSGLVVHMDLRGVSHRAVGRVIEVTFAAGENWHQQVQSCLEQGWYGMENLALIPGSMGAAPIQNIGAYGVELSDLFVSLNAIDKLSGEAVEFDRAACQFGYRDSVFKNAARDRYLIVDITLGLTTQPQINIQYPALQAAVNQHARSAAEIGPELVSAMVCQIRRQKLPDPELIPNAGSFFKNPLVTRAQTDALLQRYPQMPHYAQADGDSKIPAAWLIEQCGFKGTVRGAVGVHDRQALVLVNLGGGNGTELLELAAELCDAVKQRFAIELEIEPRVYGAD